MLTEQIMITDKEVEMLKLFRTHHISTLSIREDKAVGNIVYCTLSSASPLDFLKVGMLLGALGYKLI